MLRAVALFLFNSQGEVYVVEEQISKPEIGKRSGMLSIPMETVENNESIESAIDRLLIEEVGMLLSIKPKPIGIKEFPISSETTKKYSVDCFQALVAPFSGAPNPADTKDIQPYGWMNLQELFLLGSLGRRELQSLISILNTTQTNLYY